MMRAPSERRPDWSHRHSTAYSHDSKEITCFSYVCYVPSSQLLNGSVAALIAMERDISLLDQLCRPDGWSRLLAGEITNGAYTSGREYPDRLNDPQSNPLLITVMNIITGSPGCQGCYCYTRNLHDTELVCMAGFDQKSTRLIIDSGNKCVYINGAVFLPELGTQTTSYTSRVEKARDDRCFDPIGIPTPRTISCCRASSHSSTP